MTDAAPAPAPTPPAPEAARTEIANLVRGADAAFATAYTTPSHPGHHAARARMDALHVAAYGQGDAGDQAQPAAENSTAEGQRTANDGNSGTEGQGDVDVSAYNGITLSTLGDVDPVDGIRATGEVRELAAALALPVDLARGGTQMLEQDIARRGGRAMDQGELAAFEGALQRAAGADYDAVCGSLEAAVKRAGPRGELLRRAIVSASPTIAVWTLMSLHRSSGKGAVR
jgi:hypothetical protein